MSKGASVEGGFTQLLSLPLAISSNNSKQSLTLSQKGINVNIVFLDAVSRRHFYRSLPKTIVAFREINLNPKSTSNVLDFELYQALRAKPTETLLARTMTNLERPLQNHYLADSRMLGIRHFGRRICVGNSVMVL